MKQKRYIFFLILILSHSVNAQDIWTLNTCLDSAIANNSDIKQADMDARMATIRHNQSKFAFTPNISANANHSFYFGRSLDPVSNEFTQTTRQSTNAGVSGDLMLFSGLMRYYTLKQTDLLSANEVLNKAIITRNIKLQTTTFYLQTLINFEILKLANEHLNYTQSQENRMRKLIEAETRVENDLIEIKSQKAQDYLAFIRAENSFKLSVQELKQIMRTSENTDFMVDTNSIVSTDTISGGGLITTQEIDGLPELKQSELMIKNAELDEKISKGRYSPSLSVQSGLSTQYSDSYRVYTSDTVFFIPDFETQFNDNFSQYIGFYLNIPIYSQYNTRSNVQLRQIQTEKAIEEKNRIKSDLTNRINQLSVDISNAKGELDAAVILLELAQADYDNFEIKYTNGTINYSELLNKKDRLFNAQSNWVQSKYNYYFKRKILSLYNE